jgi:hypothetical protein
MLDGESTVRSQHQGPGCAVDSRHKLLQDRLCCSGRALSSRKPVADLLRDRNPHNPFSDSGHRNRAALIVGIYPAADDRRIADSSGHHLFDSTGRSPCRHCAGPIQRHCADRSMPFPRRLFLFEHRAVGQPAFRSPRPLTLQLEMPGKRRGHGPHQQHMIRSITSLAAVIGWTMPSIDATAPAHKAWPSMIDASIRRTPSSCRLAPFPALNNPLRSSTRMTCSTAASEDAPRSST